MRKEKTKDVISEQDVADALNRLLRVGELLASVIPPEELAKYQSAAVHTEPRKPRKAQRTSKRQGD